MREGGRKGGREGGRKEVKNKGKDGRKEGRLGRYHKCSYAPSMDGVRLLDLLCCDV